MPTYDDEITKVGKAVSPSQTIVAKGTSPAQTIVAKGTSPAQTIVAKGTSPIQTMVPKPYNIYLNTEDYTQLYAEDSVVLTLEG